MKVKTFYLLIVGILIAAANAPAQNRSILEYTDIHSDKFIKNTQRYKQYEGRVIRKINIIILEPFGKTVADTNINNARWIGRLGNLLHISTRASVIENLLLIHEGQIFDALETLESERLIGQGSFVNDSRTIIEAVGEEYVDITFIISDIWSIHAELTSPCDPYTFHLYENNFLGLAHRFDNTLSYHVKEQTDFAFSGNYTIPYIYKTYTAVSVSYSTSPTNRSKRIVIERPFFSPLTDWAGGIGLSENVEYNSPITKNGTNPYAFRNIEQDYWIGRNFQIDKLERSRRLGIAARILNIHYRSKPPPQSDTVNFHQNSTFILGTIAYNFRAFYIDRNIYRFGATEDVPTGILVALTAGYQRQELFSRPYFRSGLAYGKYFPGLGNISAGVDLGTFIHQGKAEQGNIRLSFSYFSKIFTLRKWGFRQFVHSLANIGIARLPYEKISLNDDDELLGFQSDELKGTKKMALTFQSVLYSPYSIMGFRFAPVFLIGFGMLGDEHNFLFQKTIYQSYGAGILIRNESLGFRTFQLSIAIYPFVPGYNKPVYNLNPVGVYDLRFQNFFIQKPGMVPFH